MKKRNFLLVFAMMLVSIASLVSAVPVLQPGSQGSVSEPFGLMSGFAVAVPSQQPVNLADTSITANVVYQDNNIKDSSNQMTGNDKDAHGCITSQGFVWCEVKNKCLIPQQEECSSFKPEATTQNPGAVSMNQGPNAFQRKDFVLDPKSQDVVNAKTFTMMPTQSTVVYGKKIAFNGFNKDIRTNIATSVNVCVDTNCFILDKNHVIPTNGLWLFISFMPDTFERVTFGAYQEAQPVNEEQTAPQMPVTAVPMGIESSKDFDLLPGQSGYAYGKQITLTSIKQPTYDPTTINIGPSNMVVNVCVKDNSGSQCDDLRINEKKTINGLLVYLKFLPTTFERATISVYNNPLGQQVSEAVKEKDKGEPARDVKPLPPTEVKMPEGQPVQVQPIAQQPQPQQPVDVKVMPEQQPAQPMQPVKVSFFKKFLNWFGF